MTNLAQKYKELWADKNYRQSSIFGIFFLLLSLLLYYFAASYATTKQSSPSSDLILDNLPVVNVTIIFVWGALILILFSVGLIFIEPKRIPFVTKSVAVFILIRSFFFSLTHLGLHPDYLSSSKIMEEFSFGGDLFFSGHTGLPFLMALIYWENKKLRITFLISSVLLGAAVLLGHLHYSIDVFAAFFITYSIHEINKHLFVKDLTLLDK
ncbi:MAG: conserved rane protein of unknown function [Candidatus Doudnabacteria bacterium]|nr:conserved rane protein of unknown function [Candidatus Doudnabacteria bacterium]